MVKLSGGKISTDMHVKPTDRHQYLHYTSNMKYFGLLDSLKASLISELRWFKSTE